MSTKYLLPCECGAKLEVDAAESGLTKACACGALLEVPTLSALRKLEKAATNQPTPTPTWGARQRGIAAGAVVTVLGLALTIYAGLWMGMTVREFCKLKKINLEQPLPDDLPPAQVLQFWTYLARQGLPTAPPEIIGEYHRLRRVKYWWMGVGIAVALAGASIIGCSMAFTRKSPSAARPSGAVSSPSRGA